MLRHRELRKTILKFTQQLQKKPGCGYATSKNYRPVAAAKETPKNRESNEDVLSPCRCFGELEEGARLPTAVSYLIGTSQRSQQPRNEWQMATIKYGKSLSTLEQAAREMYKNARLKPEVSMHRQSSSNVTHSNTAQNSSSLNDGGSSTKSESDDKVQLSDLSLRLSKLFLVEPESTLDPSVREDAEDAEAEKPQEPAKRRYHKS